MSADPKDYNPDNGKVSFGVSVALHIIVFGGAILFAYLGDVFKSKPKIEATPFTLMAAPDISEDSPEQPEEQLPDIKLKNIKDLKPIDLPPEPKPEPEPKPKPKPESKPEPKEAKPKEPSVSASDKAKPRIMTKAEFDRLNPKSKNPKPATTRPRAKVDFSSVKIDTSKVRFDVKPSSNTGSKISSSEFNMYAAHIQKKVRSAWIIPLDCAGMGLSVKLELLISPRGKVLKARIMRSSGNSDFDDSVNKVFRSISFNPPPGGVEFSAHMTFIEGD